MSVGKDPLTPAEAEAARLLAGLRTSQPAPGTHLVAAVTQTARWQRTARHALVALGTAVDSIAGGLGFLARRRS